MSKIKYLAANGKERQYAGFYCPACKGMHYLGVGETIARPEARWDFNFDVDKPIFSPSLLCRWGHHAEGKPESQCKACQAKARGEEDYFRCGVCHSFIGTNGAQPGQIIFLGDCTHELAGKVVDLPDIPEDA